MKKVLTHSGGFSRLGPDIESRVMVQGKMVPNKIEWRKFITYHHRGVIGSYLGIQPITGECINPSQNYENQGTLRESPIIGIMVC